MTSCSGHAGSCCPAACSPGPWPFGRKRSRRSAGYGARLDAARDDDLGDLALLPGLVDTHVHVNEPGRTEWEGFETATRAAAAGGVTTICDMPLNSLPPTVTAQALQVKRAAAAGQCAVDVAFWGGAVPGSQPELRGLHEAGVIGFKCFLADSGVPEFPPLDAAGLRAAMAETGRAGSVLAVHAEDPRELGEASGSDYRSFLASRPPRAERRAVETVIAAAAHTGSRAHIVHLSAAGCVPVIRAAKGLGRRADARKPARTTCSSPPRRYRGEAPSSSAARRSGTRPTGRPCGAGLEAGVIDCVVCDHSPCPPALKRKESGDFGAAWGGIGSLQLGLAAVWTVARRRGRTLADVARWMAAAPAALAGLSGKGVIAAGYDADLVAFDPDAAFTVRGADLQHRSPVTPYEGRVLDGSVRQVWLRGQVITPDSRPAGRLLRRPGTSPG